MIGLVFIDWVRIAVFYASYLYFPVAPLVLWLAISYRGPVRWLSVLFLMGITVLAYARFIEPRILLTNEHQFALEACFDEPGQMRVVVFADVHQGIFSNTVSIERIVKRVNAAKPDFVLVPGDFTYFLHPDRFAKTFAAFGEINAPVFAVLGNHDIGEPGPDLSAPLYEALPETGLHMIDNAAKVLSTSRFRIELVGLSDEWGYEQEFSLIETAPNKPRIILTHQPTLARHMHKYRYGDLIVAGHTHGGQIQLPLITCWLTNVCGDEAYGLRVERGAKVFTTSGTGMVGLPMRFRVPPRIDVLNIGYRACAADRAAL